MTEQDLRNIDYIDVNPSELPSVLMIDRKELPIDKGIYFALDAAGRVQYIGQAAGSKGLRQRWMRHNKMAEFSPGASIAYLCISDSRLIDKVELALVKHFNPPLNKTFNLCRPTAKDGNMKRDKRVPIMFTDKELEKLDRLADKEGVSRSEYIRKLIDREPLDVR